MSPVIGGLVGALVGTSIGVLIGQVVDGEENVAGLLNIAKCLYDAIHRLEKKAVKAEEDKKKGGGGDIDLAASVLQVRPIERKCHAC